MQGFFALLPCFLSAFSPKSSKKSAFYGAISCLPRAGANEKNKHPSGGYFSPLIPPPPAFWAYGGKSALDGAGAPQEGTGGTLPTPLDGFHGRKMWPLRLAFLHCVIASIQQAPVRGHVQNELLLPFLARGEADPLRTQTPAVTSQGRPADSAGAVAPVPGDCLPMRHARPHTPGAPPCFHGRRPVPANGGKCLSHSPTSHI